MDTAQLVACLEGSLQSDPNVRTAAESQLKAASQCPGYGVALAKTVLEKNVPDGTRQLAAVVLKQFVKQHWQMDSGERQIIPDAEKRIIRECLLQGLADPLSKIRTSVGVSIASITTWDWPENWPNLMDVLIGAIKEKRDPNFVHGALRCLALFAGDMDERQIPTVLPVLLPELRTIVGFAGKESEQMQRRAISILNSFVHSLGLVSGDFRDSARELLRPHLQSWMEVFLGLLSKPITAQDVEHWAVVIETVKTLLQFLLNFSSIMAPYVPSVVTTCCSLLVAVYPLFVQEVVNSGQEEPEVDSEGEQNDLQTLVSQVFELLMSLIGSKKYSSQFSTSLPDLLHLTLGYMQMTETQVVAWCTDPNQYLVNESEERFTARVSGELLVCEVIDSFGQAGIDSLTGAIERRMKESSDAKSHGKQDWWKCREAALAAVGHVADALGEVENGQPPRFDIAAFLENVFKTDVNVGDPCPYLVGRVMWVVAKLKSMLTPAQAEPFVQAAAVGLKAGNPVPVKIGCCCSIAQLCPIVGYPCLKQVLPDVYSAIGVLLNECTEEMLNMVLETLAAIIKNDKELVSGFEPHLSPMVLRIWSENMNDPMIGVAAVDVVEALCGHAGCWPSLCRTMLPPLTGVISNPGEHASGVVEASIDMLTILVNTGHPEVVQMVYTALGPKLMDLLCRSDDPGLLQSCTQMLRALVSSGGEALLSLGNANPETSINTLLTGVCRILDPQMEDAPALHIGQLVNCMVQHMPNAMKPFLPQMLKMLVDKLHRVNMSQVVVSLLLVFSRMVHINDAELVDALASISIQLKDGTVSNGLQVVMSIWVERYMEIAGGNNICMSATALMKLLRSRHPKLGEMQVKGEMVPAGGGVRTRSQRAKAGPDQWTMVPLFVKIFGLLVDTLVDQVADEEYVDEGDEEGGDLDGHLEFTSGKMISVGDYLSKYANAGPMVDDEPLDSNDPISNIELTQFIPQQIKEIAAEDPNFLHMCMQHFKPHQIEMVRNICQ